MDIKLLLSTRKKLLNAGVFLLILAVVDSIFTDFGLRHNYITEANAMMRAVYETSIAGFYGTKICLPLLLLYLLTKIEAKRYLQFLLSFTLVLYSFVLCLHVVWLSFVQFG